jgi:hypothetical protein
MELGFWDGYNKARGSAATPSEHADAQKQWETALAGSDAKTALDTCQKGYGDLATTEQMECVLKSTDTENWKPCFNE